MTAPKKFFKYSHIRLLVSFKVHDKSTYEKGKKTIWNFKKVNSWRDFFRVKNFNITYIDANEIYGFGNEESIGFHNHTENVVQGYVLIEIDFACETA